MSDNITPAQLSKILDHIVGTTEIIKCRRLFIDMCSRMLSLPENINQIHLLGSRCDGLMFRSSDIDGMRSIKELAVVDSQQIVPGRLRSDYLLVVVSPSSSAYVSIDVHIKHQHSISKYIYKAISKSVIQYNGRLLFTSSMFVKNIEIDGRISGPSMENSVNISLTNDYVNSFHCDIWPQFAYEWVDRNRRHSWPNQVVISLVSSAGYHLVPVGEHNSNMSPVHWRASFVLQECLLIRTFNHVQLKTYALMKMIQNELFSNFTSPTTGESLITSYHIKTLMFWVIENTPYCLWTDDNIIRCFQRCLRFLRKFLMFKFMPHYFVPTCNLFKKHAGVDARRVTEDLYNYIKNPLTVIWSLQPLLESLPSFTNIEEQIGGKRELSYLGAMFLVGLGVVKIAPEVMMSSVLATANTMDDLDFQITYGMLVRSLAYRISRVISNGDNMTSYAHERQLKCIQLMHTHLGIAIGWLQLATFFYRTCQYDKSLDVIQRKVIAPIELSPEVAFCGNALDTIQFLHIYLNYDLQGKCKESTCTSLVLFVNFALPKELDIETKLWEDIGLQILNITPLPYAYFLSFMCATQSHYTCHQLQETSLLRLKSVLNDELFGLHIRHDLVEFIVLNMVGICYEIIGNLNTADQYYTKAIATTKTHLFTEKLMVKIFLTNMKFRCIVDERSIDSMSIYMKVALLKLIYESEPRTIAVMSLS